MATRITTTCGSRPVLCSTSKRSRWELEGGHDRPPFFYSDELPHRLFYFRNPVWPFQHLARLRPVGRSNNAIALHQIDEMSGAPVADAQPPLQQGSGSFPELHHQPNRVVEERIVVSFPGLVGARFSRFALFFRRLKEFLFVFGCCLRLPELDHRC